MRRHKKASKAIDIAGRRVKIVKELGEGGFAFVFLAKDSKTGEQFALKRFVVADEEQASAIKHEIKCWKSLPEHENIVQFLGDCVLRQDPKKVESNNYVYILMEYCSGGSLVDVMQRMQDKGKSFSEKRLLKLFNTTCEAVAAMHNQNPPVIHRDLKAENILVHESKILKLCDFGSAVSEKMVPKDASRALLNRMEDNINRFTTMAFRAPEMLDLYQGKVIDEKVDTWALGCLLFKLAYFDDPFDGTQKLQILNCKYSIPETSPFSKELHSLITMLLDPDPETRPDIFSTLKLVAQMLGQPVKVKRRIYEKPLVKLFGGGRAPSPKPRKGGAANEKRYRKKSTSAPGAQQSPDAHKSSGPSGRMVSTEKENEGTTDLFGMLDWYDGSGGTVTPGVETAPSPGTPSSTTHARKLSGELSSVPAEADAVDDDDTSWAHFSTFDAGVLVDPAEAAATTPSDDAARLSLFPPPPDASASRSPSSTKNGASAGTKGLDEASISSDDVGYEFTDLTSSSPMVTSKSWSTEEKKEGRRKEKKEKKELKREKKVGKKEVKKGKKEAKKGWSGGSRSGEHGLDRGSAPSKDKRGGLKKPKRPKNKAGSYKSKERSQEPLGVGLMDRVRAEEQRTVMSARGSPVVTRKHGSPGSVPRAAKDQRGHKRGKSAAVTALPRDLVTREASAPLALTPKPDRRKRMAEEAVAAEAARLQPQIAVIPSSPVPEKSKKMRESDALARSAPRRAFEMRHRRLMSEPVRADVVQRLTFDDCDESTSLDDVAGVETCGNMIASSTVEASPDILSSAPSPDAAQELVSGALGIPNQSVIEQLVKVMWNTKSADEFFTLLPKADAKNGVSAVKVLSLSHQLMLTAHPAALVGLRDRMVMFHKLSGMWSRSSAPLGRVISTYSAFVLKKLQFHSTFPQFEGNYSLDSYFLSVLAAGQTFEVGDGSPLCRNAVLMLMDLLADNVTISRLIFADVDTLKMSVAALVPYIQECFALYVICVYLLSKLASIEPHYSMKPLIHYFTFVFGEIKATFAKIGLLELFAGILPQLPAAVPTISPDAAVRPPVSMNPDLQRQMTQIKLQRTSSAESPKTSPARRKHSIPTTVSPAGARKKALGEDDVSRSQTPSGNPRDRLIKSSSLSSSSELLDKRRNPFAVAKDQAATVFVGSTPRETNDASVKSDVAAPESPAVNPFSSPNLTARKDKESSNPFASSLGEDVQASAVADSVPAGGQGFDPFKEISELGPKNDSLSRIASRQKIADVVSEEPAVPSPKLTNRADMPNPFLRPLEKMKASHSRSLSYFL